MRFRLTLLLLLTGLCANAFAKPDFLDLFMSVYHVKDSSNLGQQECLICHKTEDDLKQLNAYGRDLREAMADAGATELTVDVLQNVGKLDSNGSGKTNEETIAADQNPGKEIPGKTVVVAPQPPKPKGLIPKNFFHPAIVHFPIALFITGLLLDFLGMRFNHKELLLCGWYNILLASISSFGGIATGFGAMFIQKVPFRGLIFQHMVLALTSAGLMLIMVAMRVHRHEKIHLPGRILYYILAASCFVLISYAGHLGGMFVYGE